MEYKVVLPIIVSILILGAIGLSLPIYGGGPPPPPPPPPISVKTLTDPVPESGALFGGTVASGDVNNDGFDDVIIGTSNIDITGTLVIFIIILVIL